MVYNYFTNGVLELIHLSLVDIYLVVKVIITVVHPVKSDFAGECRIGKIKNGKKLSER